MPNLVRKHGSEKGAFIRIAPGGIRSLMFITLALLSGCTTMVMKDLGTLGGKQAEALAINDAGQVVGTSKTASGDTHVFLWEDGVMKDLGTLGGKNSSVTTYPHVINSDGEVAGVSDTGSGSRAFLWKDGVMTDLGTLGANHSRAYAINNHGQIVGESAVSNSVMHAALWQPGSPVQDLEASLATPSASSVAVAINDSGQVTGLYKNNQGFFWENGTLTAIGAPGGTWSQPFSINEAGHVVGQGGTASGEVHAFLWANGTLTDLGTLGGNESRARDINKHGQVTGSSKTADNHEHAFLWEQGGPMINLGPKTAKAFGINDCGTVVGNTNSSVVGEIHAFKWHDGEFTDLGVLPGGHESMAFAINRHGDIAGRSTNGAGETHAVIWEKKCSLWP